MSSTTERGRHRRLSRIVVVLLVVSAFADGAAAGAQDPDPCGPTSNAIVCENAKPGNGPEDWQDFEDPGIVGFADDMSVAPGETVDFRILTDSADYGLEIFRHGWYDGLGARHVATVEPAVPLPQSQPACLTVAATGLIDCGNWAVSASWTVPPDAVSGVYRALLARHDGGGSNHVLFVVRDDEGQSDVLFQTSDTTWQAYNVYGGNSLYTGTAPGGRAYAVSYNRPMAGVPDEDKFADAEYPLVRWLERNGYDVSYTTGIDSARRGAEILEHQLFLSVGHDEYWSGEQRDAVEAARDAGVNLGFFSGNEVYWKVRWEDSVDASGAPYRTMVSYKETHANAKIDPSPEWTGTWRDPRFSPPSDGGRPENALTGTLFTVNGYREDQIAVPADFAGLRFWRNTRVAELSAGEAAALPQGTLGYEWNEDVDNGVRPAGQIRLSRTTIDLVGNYHLQDHGSTFGDGTATHSLTLHRASSGALVFGAGTIQWSWGLDDDHLFPGSPTDPAVQQATVNLFADMGVQPGTLQAGLVSAVASTDAAAPTATIVAPTAGDTPVAGDPLTVEATASDTGGGVVAGVEVSTDGGATWHPADVSGASWTHTFVPIAAGSVEVLARATDDSVNTGPEASASVTVVPRPCPCSLWTEHDQPAQADAGDGSTVELGLRFRAEQDGFITGIRFFKATANTGSHVGTLWSALGQPLATAAFDAETASGWQEVTFASPVPVQAGALHVASYHAPDGHYSADSGGLTASRTLGPLTAPAAGDVGGNGVYRYGASGFPTSTHGATNYWVDVVYEPGPPDTSAPYVIGRSPSVDDPAAPVDTSVVVTFNERIDASTLAFGLEGPDQAPVDATVTWNASTRSATLTPTAPLTAAATHLASVEATDLHGNPMAAPDEWSFTTGVPGECPCTLFGTTVPGQVDAGDSSSVEVGVRFTPAVDGYALGVRFYRSRANIGIHTGSLWNPQGVRLGTGTFVEETAEGWQQLWFDAPVVLHAGQSYVASYHDPAGHYSADAGRFATAYTVGPLTAPASTAAAPNGVYRTGSSGFPDRGYNATSYGVDVLFAETLPPDERAPTVASTAPADGGTGASVIAEVRVVFSEPMDAGSLQADVTDAGGQQVAVTSTYDEDTRTVKVVPTAPMAAATTHHVTVDGADLSGNAMAAPATWSFTTGGAGDCPCTILGPRIPTTSATQDPNPTEVGVRFSSDVDGFVTGLRFWKGTGNDGPHRGTVWRADGTALGTALFTGETPTGWQTVTFDAPIPVAAGVVHVASYFAPNGRYASEVGGFEGGVDTAPLHAPPDGTWGRNGVYRYGSGGGFPDRGHAGTNYFVDVVFESAATDARPPQVIGRSPAPDTVDHPILTDVVAEFSEPIDPATLVFELAPDGGSPVAASISLDDERTARLDPTSDLTPGATYGVTVRASDTLGNRMAVNDSWSFAVGAAQGDCPCTIFGDEVPVYESVPDASPIELGVRFSADADGVITGIRFHKGSQNTGTHVGTLWTNDGQQLSSATFTNEGTTGWQTVMFPTPVPIGAGAVLVASYHTSSGYYSATSGAFSGQGRDAPPLHALASGVAGANGVYRYGAHAFPTSSHGDTSYGVDVVYEAAAADGIPPTTTSTDPGDAATDVPAWSTPRATFDEPVEPGSIEFELRDASGALEPGVVTYASATRIATLDPTADLTAGEAYTASIRARDLAGNVMPAPTTWAFTVGTASCPCSLLGDAAPGVVDGGDGSAIELGVRLQPAVDGWITGIRYHRSAANTGLHVGTVWAADGTELASVEFTDETATGWQEVALPVPVAVGAGTVVVVSYHTATGHYSYDGGWFASAQQVGPLTAPANAGVYRYGAHGFPSNTYGATNYWVDAVFESEASP